MFGSKRALRQPKGREPLASKSNLHSLPSAQGAQRRNCRALPGLVLAKERKSDTPGQEKSRELFRALSQDRASFPGNIRCIYMLQGIFPMGIACLRKPAVRNL